MVNYNKLSDDGKIQNIVIQEGDPNAMPTLDDFKIKLLKRERYVILYGFSSEPINLTSKDTPPPLLNEKLRSYDYQNNYYKQTEREQVGGEPARPGKFNSRNDKKITGISAFTKNLFTGETKVVNYIQPPHSSASSTTGITRKVRSFKESDILRDTDVDALKKRVKNQLSEGLSSKGYPDFSGPMKAKVVYGTGPSFGGGSFYRNKNHLTDGTTTIVGGVYIMIKKSDFDSLNKARFDAGLYSSERFSFENVGLYTEFKIEYDLPALWECKFKLTKNNGQRLHDGRYDLRKEDILSSPPFNYKDLNEYNTNTGNYSTRKGALTSSPLSYKTISDSMITQTSNNSQNRGYFYWETKEEYRFPDTLTKIVTGDVDFVQLPNRGKDVYWQHWYGVDFGKFAGVDPVQIERFLRPFYGSISNEGIDEGESRYVYALKPGTDSRYNYDPIMNHITPLYYTATKSPNESIYFKNVSFPRPLESQGIQFVFNPREVFITARRFGNISFAEAELKEREESQIYHSTIAGRYDQYINTINDHIDRQFSSAIILKVNMQHLLSLEHQKIKA